MCPAVVSLGETITHVIMTWTCRKSICRAASVDEESGQLYITLGSAYKTCDAMVDALEAWWAAVDASGQVAMARLQIKMDNGPESSGRRTQFLHRMGAFCDTIGNPMHLLYYPPYHSKDNPIERCWGILE
jgi:Rhodopirellula transposase DDE domain